MNQVTPPHDHAQSMRTLSITYPQELLLFGDVNHSDIERLARESLFVHLYERGYISSGKAADMLGLSHRAFLDLLGTYHVSVFDDTMDIHQELHHAATAHCLQHKPTY